MRFAPRDRDRREEVADHDQRADREQDHAEVKRRLGAQRNVRGEQHVRFAGPHHPFDHQRAGSHQAERDPAEPRRGQAGGEQRRRGEVEDRHLEEQDVEDQHVHAVHGEDPVEPDRIEQVHRLPAREQHEQRSDTADQQRDRRGDRVGPDQRVGPSVYAQPRRRAGSHGGAHCASPGSAAAGTTITLPVIRWWPTPQNSLQMIEKSPDAFGFTRSA